MMRYIKWLIFNSVIAFIIVDGTFGLTSYSQYASNFIPFLVFMLFALSIIAAIIIAVIAGIHSEMERDTLIELRGKLYKSSKFKIWLNILLDLSLSFVLAIFGFTFSAILFFLHLIFTLITIWFKNELVKDLNKI